MSKYFKYFILIKITIFLTFQVNANEQKSNNVNWAKWQEDYQIILELQKKHGINSKDHEFEIRKKILDCPVQDKPEVDHKKYFSEAKKLLNFYFEEYKILKYDHTAKDYIDFLNFAGWCAEKVHAEKKKYIKYVRDAIDEGIFEKKILFSGKSDPFIGSLILFYAKFTNLFDDTPIQRQWVYDEKILNTILKSKDNLTLLMSFLLQSDQRLYDDYTINKTIEIVKPFIENYKANNNELIEFSDYIILSKSYLDLLRSAKRAKECSNFYDLKISNIKIDLKNLNKRINLIDLRLQCSMAEADFNSAYDLMKSKIKLIKEGLAKVKYSKDDEEDLYNNLIRSMYASGSALKTTEIGLNEYAEAERLIKDARELNKSYFYNRDLWTYLYLNQNFIEDDLRESKFYKAETSINEAILLINKLNSENYRYHKFGDWKEEKETYLRDYLTMYAQIFFLTGRFKESIDIYEKVVTTYKKRFKKDFGTSDITKIKSASIEKFHLMSTYMNLLKIYNKVGDTKQQKKYVNILYQICKVDGQTIAKALCSSIYREKIEYHKQSNDLDGLIKTIEEIEKFYANFKIVNPYITFLSEQELLQAKMEANILQLKILERKNQSNSTKFKKLNEQGCHFVDQMNQKNTEMSKFIKNKQVSYDFKFRFSTITIGTYFMESGLQCEKKIEDAQIQLSQIDEIINLYEKKIENWVKLPQDFYKSDLSEEILTQLFEVISLSKDIYPENKEEFDMRARKLFYLNQSGKNFYLTQSIKRSISEEVVGNSELKKLISSRNYMQRELDQYTKEIFSLEKIQPKHFSKVDELKKNISKLNNEIKNNHSEFNEILKQNYRHIEEVQKKLKEDEAMIVFDGHLYVSAHIITKRKYETFSNYGLDGKNAKIGLNLVKTQSNPKSKIKDLKKIKNDLNLSYERIFKPIEKYIDNKDKIIIVSDKIFEDFPVGLLFDKSRNLYLAQKYSISYYPSVGSFIDLRSSNNQKTLTTKNNFLGIGDPKLDAKNENFNIVSINDFKFNSRGILEDTAKITEMFSNLPYSKTEINELGKLFESKKILLSENANESIIKDLDMRQFDIISFATHASVSGSLEGFNEPFLVLTPPSEPTNENDGILTASEVSLLNINADIVILSACNTASKDNEYAPGFSGLVSAFFRSGARSVLATHWPISDKATSIMINEIIKKKVYNNLDYSSALKQTKSEFIQGKYGKKYQNPAFWASYVIIGG